MTQELIPVRRGIRAWMSFTWCASSYGTDDVLYRLMTLLQMAFWPPQKASTAL